MDQSTEHDFDFLIGNWRVQHRRLRERMAGSVDWEIFDGTSATVRTLGGLGNLEDNLINLPGGSYRALALRSFDARTRQWAIWWLDGRHPHSIDVPVIGGFERGVGSFFASDTLDGQPIRVRFLWSETDSASPMWEQAFSADSGTTWETNWSMRFIRQL